MSQVAAVTMGVLASFGICSVYLAGLVEHVGAGAAVANVSVMMGAFVLIAAIGGIVGLLFA